MQIVLVHVFASHLPAWKNCAPDLASEVSVVHSGLSFHQKFHQWNSNSIGCFLVTKRDFMRYVDVLGVPVMDVLCIQRSIKMKPSFVM